MAATALRVEPRTEFLDAAVALEAARTAAWRWSLGSNAIEWSPGASRVLGIPEVVLRSPDLLLAAVDPEDLALARNAVGEQRGGAEVCTQLRIRLAGRVRWFDVAGRLLPGEDGAPAFATGTLRDVTDDREAQDALLDALREAEEVLAQLDFAKGSAGTRRTRVA